jgi:hypothetical protein
MTCDEPRAGSQVGMSQSQPPGTALADSLAPWREAWRIRRAHPKWVVLWTAQASQYQAFRLSRRHRDALLAAATPEELATQIEHAERAEQARRAAPPRR